MVILRKLKIFSTVSTFTKSSGKASNLQINKIYKSKYMLVGVDIILSMFSLLTQSHREAVCEAFW